MSMVKEAMIAPLSQSCMMRVPCWPVLGVLLSTIERKSLPERSEFITQCDLPNWSYGGGISVCGSTPLKSKKTSQARALDAHRPKDTRRRLNALKNVVRISLTLVILLSRRLPRTPQPTICGILTAPLSAKALELQLVKHISGFLATKM